jgi:hypothetical protein
MVRGAHTGLLSIGVLLVDSGLIGLRSAFALSFSDRLLDVGTARLFAYGSDIVFETVFAPAGSHIVQPIPPGTTAANGPLHRSLPDVLPDHLLEGRQPIAAWEDRDATIGRGLAV